MVRASHAQGRPREIGAVRLHAGPSVMRLRLRASCALPVGLAWRLPIALAARGATKSIFAGLTLPFALVVEAEWPEALGLGHVPDQARRACVLTLACLCGASRGFGWRVAHLGREPELVSFRIVKSCDSLHFPRVYLDHFHVAAQALGATCDR